MLLLRGFPSCHYCAQLLRMPRPPYARQDSQNYASSLQSRSEADPRTRAVRSLGGQYHVA